MGRAGSSISVTHIWVKGKGSMTEPDSRPSCEVQHPPGYAEATEASHLMYTQMPVPKVRKCLLGELFAGKCVNSSNHQKMSTNLLNQSSYSTLYMLFQTHKQEMWANDDPCCPPEAENFQIWISVPSDTKQYSMARKVSYLFPHLT